MATLTAAVPDALAATEFGDPCAANFTSIEAASSQFWFALTAPGDPLPLTAPSGGVLTAWKVDSDQPESMSETVKVLRPSEGDVVRVVGESTGTVAPGVNVFPTRIAVQAGDRLALYLTPKEKIFLCGGPETHSTAGAYEGDSSLGSTVSYIEEPSEFRFPVVGVIEPDADGDGFGDETQHQCPQSAAPQAPCPVVVAPPSPSAGPIVLNASATAGRHSVSVFVTAGAQATVSVAGNVKLGMGKSARLGAGTQTVVPGTLAKFAVPFPKRLTARLRQLSPKRSLSVNLTASAPNASGPATTDSLKVRLRGQANRRSHRHPARQTTRRSG